MLGLGSFSGIVFEFLAVHFFFESVDSFEMRGMAERSLVFDLRHSLMVVLRTGECSSLLKMLSIPTQARSTTCSVVEVMN